MARQTRATVVGDIRATLAPLFRPSGWRQITGMDESGITSETVMLCAYKDHQPREVGGFIVDDILAFTPTGVIEFAYAGGAASIDWDAMPLEDLRLVLAEARRAAEGGLLN